MHFINLRDNRYRCLDLTDSRSTTATRTTSNIGDCSVVPPSHCGYHQGGPSPYLDSRRSRGARLSVISVNLADNNQSPSTPVTSVVPSLPSRRNTSRGYRWVTRLLPSRTPVDSGSYQQVQPGGVTLDGTLEMVLQRQQRNELKRIILVSPRWCRDTSGMN